MLAVDTNVIVRYLTGDHPNQSAIARKLVDTTQVFVCKTVMLETEWVLRSTYGFAVRQVCAKLRAFAGLPTVSVENAAEVADALSLCETGLDFADALHLQSAAGCEALITFDREFAKRTKRAKTAEVRAL